MGFHKRFNTYRKLINVKLSHTFTEPQPEIVIRPVENVPREIHQGFLNDINDISWDIKMNSKKYLNMSLFVLTIDLCSIC